MNTSIYFFLGAIVAAIIVIAFKSTKKQDYSYDERQILVRGNAYKMGFVTLLILSSAYMLLCVAFEELLQYGYIWTALSIFTGLTTFAVYSIWNDAFFALKQNPKKYLMLCAIVIVCNSIGILEVVKGYITFEDLFFSYKIINALCALSFLIIACTIIVKILADRKEQD